MKLKRKQLMAHSPNFQRKTIPGILLLALMALSVILGFIIFSVRAATRPADINSDGNVNVFDLSILLSDWAKTGASLRSDLNDDAKVDVFDLSMLLAKWGPAGTPTATPTPTPTPTATPSPTPSTYAVNISGFAFSPQTITIRRGDAVKFTNNTDRQVWPASNPHPQHTAYPGFEPLSPIDPGGSWSFTFTQAGTWGYHDHIMAGVGGTIVVE